MGQLTEIYWRWYLGGTSAALGLAESPDVSVVSLNSSHTAVL